jgi:hypothetical protein
VTPIAAKATRSPSIFNTGLPALGLGFLPNDFGLGGSVDKGAIEIVLPEFANEGRPENVLPEA